MVDGGNLSLDGSHSDLGMITSHAIFLFGATALASWLAGFGLRWVLLRSRIVDKPEQESRSHSKPTPRGGGLLIVAAFFAWYFFTSHKSLADLGIDWLATSLGVLAGISFLDDIRAQSRRLRLLICCLASAAFLTALLTTATVSFPGPELLVVPAVWLWLVGYSNTFNFIDGINGLAGMQALTALLAGAVFCSLGGADELVTLQVVLAGAMIGFLGHNLFRGRIFLGEVGSVSTGYLLAVISILAGSQLGWRTGLAIAALHLGPTLDVCITIFRRLRRGDIVYHRYRDFFFHRAVRSGRSHLFVTSAESAIQCIGAIGLGLALHEKNSAWPVFAAIGAIAVLWLVFFCWCERQFLASCPAEKKS